MKVYVNGEIGCQESGSGIPTTSSSENVAYIGHAEKFESSEKNYDMMLDDLAFFCAEISQTNIRFIYNY